MAQNPIKGYYSTYFWGPGKPWTCGFRAIEGLKGSGGLFGRVHVGLGEMILFFFSGIWEKD